MTIKERKEFVKGMSLAEIVKVADAFAGVAVWLDEYVSNQKWKAKERAEAKLTAAERRYCRLEGIKPADYRRAKD